MIINICLLMAILSFNSCDENTASPYIPSQEGNDSIPATTGHLTTRSTIADVLAHPAFEGFSQYILPLEWGYDEDMPLSEVERLLPYHNYIDAERCVGYINQMIDSVAAGRRIYYDLGRKDAGLFFFRGRSGAPFAVVCPGGGFSYVGSIHEGFPHALALSRMGYMRLSSNTRRAAHRRLARTWRRALNTFSATPRTCRSIRQAIPCGVVRRGRVWLHTSVHTARRLSVRHSFPVRARW